MSGIRLFASAVIALVFVLGACATAGEGGGNNGNIDAPGNNVDGSSNVDAPGGNIDAPSGNIDAPGTPIDAPAGGIDAALQTITLSQSNSMAVTALNTVACHANTITAENSYYRVFQLSSFGVVRPFTAQRIDFGVETANAEIGTSQTIQVRLHTLNGAFITTNLTNVAGQNVTVADTTTGIVVPVALSPAPVIPSTATLVAEIFIPDGDVDNNGIGNSIFVGSNAGGETGSSYIRAPDTGCAITQPTTMAAAGFPNVHVVLTVTGVF